MSTFILLHVIIAVASIVLSSFVFFKPTMKRLYGSYGFVVATVASGTLLLVTTPSNILQGCLSGLFYLTVVSLITIATHVRIRKFAQQEM